MILRLPSRRTAGGAAAMMLAVLLWASFALTLRGLSGSTLTTIDVTLLRFGTPLVLLAPGIPRTLRRLREERTGTVLLLLVGGLPHFLLSALGGSLAPAALVGLLIPGTVPLFVTLFTLCGLLGARSRVRGTQLAAAAVIGAGVLLAAGQAGSADVLLGVGVLLAAGCAWAVYTCGLRDTGLSLSSVVLVICAPSAALATLLALTGAMPSALLQGTASPGETLLLLALQGIGTGVLSTVAYAQAVRLLGGGPAATAGALSPVVTAVLAAPLLAEPVTPGRAAALAVIVAGVVLFNAPRTRRRMRLRPRPGAETPTTAMTSMTSERSATATSPAAATRSPVRATSPGAAVPVAPAARAPLMTD